MHSVAYKSCRIHYNGDFSGDVIITNRDVSSTPIDKRATISYSLEGLIRCFEIQQGLYPEGISAFKTIKIDGKAEQGYDKEIEILFSDIESFVKDLLMDKIIEEIEKGEASIGDLKTIASILNIRLLRE